MGDDGGSLFRVSLASRAVEILAVVGSRIGAVACASPGTVVFGTDDERLLAVSAPPAAQLRALSSGHSAEIKILARTSADQFLSGGRDGRVAIWKVDEAQPRALLRGIPAVIRGVAVSPMGHVAICAENRVLVFAGKQLFKVGELVGHLSEAWSVAFHPTDGRIYCGFENGQVHLLAQAAPDDASVLQAHQRRIRSLCFSQSGTRMATGSSDRHVRIWRLDDGTPGPHSRLPTKYRWLRALTFLEDARYLAFGAGDGHLRIWDSSSTSLALELKVHSGDIHALCLAGKELLSVAADCRLSATSLTTGATRCIAEFSEIPRAVAWCEGSGVAFVGLDGRLAAVELNGSLPVRYYGRRGAFVYSMQCSSDGRRLFVAGSDGLLSQWDVEEGTLELRLSVEAHRGACNALALHKGGELLATAGADGSVRTWAAADLELSGTYRPPLPYSGLRLKRSQVTPTVGEDLERLGVRFEA